MLKQFCSYMLKKHFFFVKMNELLQHSCYKKNAMTYGDLIKQIIMKNKKNTSTSNREIITE